MERKMAYEEKKKQGYYGHLISFIHFKISEEAVLPNIFTTNQARAIKAALPDKPEPNKSHFTRQARARARAILA